VTTSPSEDRPPGRARRATIYGTGLIGGSLGLALTGRGWRVSGIDATPGIAERALELGAIAEVGEDHSAGLVVVATPVHVAAEVVRHVLAGPFAPDTVVTDVGSVKGPLVESIGHPFFVGGHPMAGSEQVGIDGAAADLFVGATWVLTPTASTDADAYARLRAVLADLGADVVALDPGRHDSLVAVISHVPHLTAATLMTLAADLENERAAVLKLAAGGFRDMTRIAAGQPTIWPGICDDNAEAIVETLDQLIDALAGMRRRVAERDHDALLEVLGRAAAARRALTERVPRTDGQAEVRIPVADRVGVLKEITTLATDLGVSIDDIEIAHSVEGDRGVLVLVVDARSAPTLVEAVTARGYRAAITPLGTPG
jgi:prephenate dehydrogenase